MVRPIHISVVGAGDADPSLFDLAYQVGRLVAQAGCVLVCGGLGGVMAGACRGAREHGGKTVGVLPGPSPAAANPWAEVVLATGLGHARNVVVVQSGDAVLALPGSWGTLSEISLALKNGRPVVGLRAWREIEGVEPADSPQEAVDLALRAAGRAY
jgi:uncharacterized protein (TIGR00725 family)